MDVFELTRALVDIESITGDEGRVGQFLLDYLKPLAARFGGRVERMDVEAGRFNVFAQWGERLTATLSTHMDTVPPFFASRDDGERSRLIFDPARVGRPRTSNRFFTANGTPASRPAFFPAAMAASIARALARARSTVTSVNEFRTGSYFAIRANAASVTLSADTCRPFTASAISPAESPSRSAVTAISGCKDTGRLGFVG